MQNLPVDLRGQPFAPLPQISADARNNCHQCSEQVQLSFYHVLENETTTVTEVNSTSKPEDNPQDSPVFIQLSKEELERHFVYPQPEAARRLGVSVSTLKRRFYDNFNGTRWPYAHYKKVLRKRTISYILNPKEKPAKQLDPHTIHILKKAFKTNAQHGNTSL